MTITESFYAALIAGSPKIRVYPDLLPPNPLLPASVYTQIAGLEDQDIGGTPVQLVNGHFQLDTYALTRKEAEEVSLLGRDNLIAAADLQVWITNNGVWTYEEDTQRFRMMREYSVWLNV